MALQYHRLYLITHICGHTVPLKSLSALTRQQIYQREAEPCQRCQKASALGPSPARKTNALRKPNARVYKTARRYEGAYQALCRKFPDGKVPVDAFACILGIGTSPVYKWFQKTTSDLTSLRVENGCVCKGG